MRASAPEKIKIKGSSDSDGRKTQQYGSQELGQSGSGAQSRHNSHKSEKTPTLKSRMKIVSPKNNASGAPELLKHFLPASLDFQNLPSLSSLRKESEWRSLDTSRTLPYAPSFSLQDFTGLPASARWAWIWEIARYPTLVTALGLLTSLLGIFILTAIQTIKTWHSGLVNDDLSDRRAWAEYVGVACALALLAAWVTHAYCPLAVGGGIPEVKTLLSGMKQPHLVSTRLLMAKTLGLIFGMGAGVSGGTEGPLIHIACAAAEGLMGWLPFRRVGLEAFRRLDVLGHACAAGVAVAFGTPFAAVLFSIEVTSSSYRVNALPATLFTAVAVCVCSYFLGQLPALQLFENENVEFSQGYNAWDILIVTILALLCGLAASIFVRVAIFVTGIVGWIKGKTPSAFKIYALTFFMILMISPIMYLDTAKGIVGGQATITANLFNPQYLKIGDFLVYYLPLKIFVTIISINMPLPIGLFDAVFLIGGCMGRIFGSACNEINLTVISFEPWELAIAAAVFFSSGVTHTLAPAVVVYELAGARLTSLPLCLGTFISYGISSLFTPSIYDLLIKDKGVPFLPDLQPDARRVPVFRLMLPAAAGLPVLALTSTYREVRELLEEYGEGPHQDPAEGGGVGSAMCPQVPVVDSLETNHLVGTVAWEHLRHALLRFDQALEKGVMLTPADLPYSKTRCYGFDLTARATPGDHDLFRNSFVSDQDIDQLRESYHGTLHEKRRSFRESSTSRNSRRPSAQQYVQSAALGIKPSSSAVSLDQFVPSSYDSSTASPFLAHVRGRRKDDDEDGIGMLQDAVNGGSQELDLMEEGLDSSSSGVLRMKEKLRSESAARQRPPRPDGGEGSVSPFLGLFGRQQDSSGSERGGRRQPPAARGGGRRGSTNGPSPAPGDLPAGFSPGQSGYATPSDLPWVSGGASRRKSLGNSPRIQTKIYVNKNSSAVVDAAGSTRLLYIILKEGGNYVPISAVATSTHYVIEKITVPINPSPYQVVHTTELGELDHAFRMLKASAAFVTRCGRLEGVLTREALRQFTVAYTKDPLEQSIQICGALGNNLKFF